MRLVPLHGRQPAGIVRDHARDRDVEALQAEGAHREFHCHVRHLRGCVRRAVLQRFPVGDALKEQQITARPAGGLLPASRHRQLGGEDAAMVLLIERVRGSLVPTEKHDGVKVALQRASCTRRPVPSGQLGGEPVPSQHPQRLHGLVQGAAEEAAKACEVHLDRHSHQEQHAGALQRQISLERAATAAAVALEIVRARGSGSE
mmetsp:Transcript_18685/g.52186  ORF Transcript_18685/g.52186 Transcript_18685/m.52186 type:complete len:203 (+) Transcript_18685:882-1490(+)